ncbi:MULTISPECIES: phospholipase D-like domain-containing protein [Phenylobacterium]|uniref:Phospholipase D n=1 Tax=Phenylobacterium koreense TaxID=266125 RepID=A0ABV2EDT8_9CAUL
MDLLRPGETCWRKVRADRAAFLVDTEVYFTAVFEALRKARRSVLLLGWGFDPRARLFPDGFDGPADPDEVGRILVALARARPDLDIRLLIWKSALPIAASQQFFPHKARHWFRGTGVKFWLDDHVPFGACHHQKVLVIDDKLAFCGGGDISIDRWDTPGHLENDPRRIMPDQHYHPPRHEVMVMVDGAAAASMGDLARERWRRATGEAIPEPEPSPEDPWPVHVPAHLKDVEVSIQRTEPGWDQREEVAEIRRLTVESILSAKSVIYLENQYFTSPLIARALALRLAEPDGPEVVLISTGRSPSWFDQMTMDRARSNMLWRLRSADVFGRFRAFYPTTPSGMKIIVHSKVTVIDDTLARVGSANLNNRSGGFDTEAEIAVQAGRDGDRLAIQALRDRLIGHFMGLTGDAIGKARAERGGSLVAAIDFLNREGRLAPILPMKQTILGEIIATYHVGDPFGVPDSWDLIGRRELLYDETPLLQTRFGPH